MNRIDDVSVFNALEKEHIHKIINIEIEKLYERVSNLGYQLELTPEALDFIADKGFDKQYGARPLKRAIQKYVEDLLAEEIINGNIQENDVLLMDKIPDEEGLKVTVKNTNSSLKN